MNKLTEEEVIDKLIPYLNTLEERKSNTVWVIRINDKIVRLPSGKSSWRKQNHATSAFTNSIYGWVSKYSDGWSPSDVTKFLIKEGIIKIEQLV